MSIPPPPNWYPDPKNPAFIRWWDGQRWTESVQANPAAPQINQQTRPVGQAPASAPPAVVTPQTQAEPPRPTPKKVGFFGARATAQSLADENEVLRAALAQVAGLDLAEVLVQTGRAKSELARAREEQAAVQAQVRALKSQVLNVRDAINLQEFGLYDYEHPAEAAAQLAGELSAVRVQIRQAITDKHATAATSNFTFNNSAAKGRAFVSQMSKMMLAAYNAEAENAVKTVKAGGLSTATARLEKAADRVSKNGQMIDLHITAHYHRLRVRELELAARHLEAVKAEKEAERAHREELREAKRAEDELRREREKLDKERSHYVNALAAVEQRGDEAGAAELRAKLEGVDKAIADVDYRAANVRAGYVYVISNIGSMGERMVKIGMTRRLDPMDRIRELSDASVPFNFDVHALFFSEDAFGVEAMLHRQFAGQRVNRVNLRREFFYASPAEVLEVLKEHNVALVEYRTEALAEEFHASKELARAPQSS